jgi:hypothetical protein
MQNTNTFLGAREDLIALEPILHHKNARKNSQ